MTPKTEAAEPDVRKTFFDKCFKDKQGAIVLGQKPNKWIWLWLGFTVAAIIETRLSLIEFANSSAIISGAALFQWAQLEFREGVNYYRRALGALAMICVLSVLLTTVRLYIAHH